MTVREMAEKLHMEILSGEDGLTREVENGYCGDLLSWVMAKAKQNDAWITIMSNTNIVAVAVLTDVSCIILCEGVEPDDNCLEKAKAQGVTLLKTDMSEFEAACAVKACL